MAAPRRHFAAVLLLATTNCGPPAEALLERGAAGLDELGRGVVAALIAGDTAALAAYRVTEEEHNLRLWPHFPAARQTPPIDVGFSWQNIQRRNAAALQRLLARHRGESLRVVATECNGESEDYAVFQVLRDCLIRVEGGGQQTVRTVRPFASVVVANGRYKVIRYDA